MGDIEEPYQSRWGRERGRTPRTRRRARRCSEHGFSVGRLGEHGGHKRKRAQDEKDVEDPEDVEDSEDAERGNPTLAKEEHMGQTKKRRCGTPGRDGGAGTCRRCSRRRRHGAYMRSRRSRGRG